MRVTSLSLRNFRVFPELDLEMPPGVVGIYGPNGAGKSTLAESIMWARSAVEQIEAARLVLGDVEALAAEATDLEARLVAATAVRLAAEAAQATAEQAEAAAAAEAAEQERRKQERDRLAAAYGAARRR